MTRYAIYFAPPAASALWRFGSSVIGYDAATGADEPFLSTFGLSEMAWRALTSDPRRYGFHATLKAPFELAAGRDEQRLLGAISDLAATLPSVSLDSLRVAEIGRFVAVVPAAPSDPLQALAAAVVVGLDHLRAPLTEADRARRLASPLTPRQIAHLDRYGYPYVLEEFRFHMTLTGPIADADQRRDMRQRLEARFAAAVPSGPTVIDALAVFRQERRDGRFRIIARSAVGGPQRSGALR